ncbi:polysaccharide biosynthesis tyrosine autokinase [Crateriforma conspicua]|uniref:polysaccharide biosynthesis tyrosine autokinase n=1 Tax=Crateriforma conspicua TaxID=2527996 RepID=UPI00118D3BFA|nr:polysaccharide biosynthesis tyrosine autokinase [Crateriforma conspicua]QDV63034.1 Tyrosine-protein kinase YwqD [Crateriforma conspicua]
MTGSTSVTQHQPNGRGGSTGSPRSGLGLPLRNSVEAINLPQLIARQRWLILFLGSCGLAMGVAYATHAEVLYESQAKVLVAQRSAGLNNSGTGTDVVDEDVLANHMGLIRSRKIVSEALAEYGLMELPSLVAKVSDETDQVDYVIQNTSIGKGGDGSARSAAIMNITLQHNSPEDVQKILAAIMRRYERFIVSQVESVMGEAGRMIQDAKRALEADLQAAEEEYLVSRQNAPLFFQGEGSSNVYQDRYRRLSEELLELDIQQSTMRTRLERVRESLKHIGGGSDLSDHLDKLALIDSDSLERLGAFAGLQVSASNSAEFKAAMPAKMEEARAQVTRLLMLNAEREKLTAVFGSGHPKVREINNEIQLVEDFVRKSKEQTSPEMTFGSQAIKPDALLRAYIGFIEHDIAAIGERRKELIALTTDAESKAKELIEFELKDLVLQKKIARHEAIFDGIVGQLQELNTASGLSGFLYEFLEVPRLGKRVWPNVPLCSLGGLVLGLLCGMVLAVGNELRDSRFRTAQEVDEAIGLLNLGHVGQMSAIDQGIAGLVATDGSSESEAFRLGRTILLPDIKSKKVRSIGFTSSMQGDGKSTIVANFAQAFAQVGLNVVVVDCDLRRPSQHRYLSLQDQQGMSEVLQAKFPLAEVIQPTEIENLSAISAGKTPENPAELLQGVNLDKAIESLSNHFDLVLVDLPPVLAVSDPAVVLPRLDGAVLVVRVARIRREQLANALQRLQSTGANLIGSMLNVVGADKEFDAGVSQYGYYRNDYTRSSSQRKRGRAAATPGSVNNAA